MDKEGLLLIDDTTNHDNTIDILLGSDTLKECINNVEDVKERYIDNDENKIYDLKQITSPKENDTNDVSELRQFEIIINLTLQFTA